MPPGRSSGAHGFLQSNDSPPRVFNPLRSIVQLLKNPVTCNTEIATLQDSLFKSSPDLKILL